MALAYRFQLQQETFSVKKLHLSLTIGNIHLITMRKEMWGTMVPGKLYSAMGCGRPVLFVGPDDCEVALTIKEYNCGLVINNHDITSLHNAILNMKNDVSWCEQMGQNGIKAYLEHFEQKVCCEKWITRIK